MLLVSRYMEKTTKVKDAFNAFFCSDNKPEFIGNQEYAQAFSDVVKFLELALNCSEAEAETATFRESLTSSCKSLVV